MLLSHPPQVVDPLQDRLPFAYYPGFQKNCVCLKPLYRGRVRKPIDPMQLCWLYCKEKTR